MNATNAQTFENGRSTRSEIILAMAAQDKGCECEAYIDWFTYKRWQAQGFQVQKGEKGVCLLTFREGEKKDEKTGKVKQHKRPWRSYVFCRCQVKTKV
jgi:antirestriction protein ArdC